MFGTRIAKSLVVAVAAAAIAVAGTAFAATGGTGSGPTGFFDAVAKHLGISSEKLQDATKAAAAEQVDAALAAGSVTEEQAAAMKERIEARDGYALGGPGHRGLGHRGGGHLDDAATYLGLGAAELRTQLAGGKTLGEVAEAEGKTVAGLKAALLASEKAELDAAVADGRLTQAQADEKLAGAGDRFDAMIAGTLPDRGGHGFGKFGPPPVDTGGEAASA